MVSTELGEDREGNVVMTLVFPKELTFEEAVLWLMRRHLEPSDGSEHETALSKPARQEPARQAVAAH